MVRSSDRKSDKADHFPRSFSGIRGLAYRFILLGLLLVPILWQDMPVVGGMRLAWLDGYQALSPRERHSAPAVVVAVDDASLSRFGQWPWPRNLIAELIDRVAAARPAAIGVDILFSEPDRLSPEWLVRSVSRTDPVLAQRLAKLPRNDAVLAASIKAAPVVLGIAGLEVGAASPSRPFTPSLQRGADLGRSLRQYASTLRSLPEIDDAARGHGLLSTDTENGVVRRVAAVARVGMIPILPLSLETLRLASGEPFFVVYGSDAGIKNVQIGDLTVPTQSDGRLWVHYTPHDAGRFISAAGILTGEADPALLERKLVLIGVTGLGLIDYQTTPLGERMPGIEIHAQVLENVFDKALLQRPDWALWAEGAAFLAASLIVIYAVPRISPGRSAGLLALVLTALGSAGFIAYREAGQLFDASVPGVAILALFSAMLGGTLAKTNAQRKVLAERLRLEREAAARLGGELDAARRIQIGILPRAESTFPAERRFEISASMEPAREVGGDLYDFFMLDDHRLFFIVGDVSGKGVPASIFMAVSKALCKSAAMRSGRPVNELLGDAAEDIARENPESLFVTAFAGVLDVRSGALEYCNAGHEYPLVFDSRDEIKRLDEGGGPPLCVLDGFPYELAGYQLSRGATLCVVSDGVTEAMNPAGELFGVGRLRSAIDRVRHNCNPQDLAVAIRADVTRFVAGAEAADDLTLLVLRWNGP